MERDWTKKAVSAEEAVGLIQSRMNVFVHGAAITPTPLLKAMVWWYRKYAREPSPKDQGRYEFEEQEARSRKAGLWSDAIPTLAWEVREQRKGILRNRRAGNGNAYSIGTRGTALLGWGGVIHTRCFMS